MKHCFKCGQEKPVGEFYAHPDMADGRLGKCKECTKSDVKRDRRENPRVREYDRARSVQPHRAALRAKVTREWRAKHPDRARAHQVAARGVLDKPAMCEGCNAERRLERHHHDYSRPLAVVWLCKPCHAIADKLRRRLEAS